MGSLTASIEPQFRTIDGLSIRYAPGAAWAVTRARSASGVTGTPREPRS